MIELLLALCLRFGVCEPAMVEALEARVPPVVTLEPSFYQGMGTDWLQWRSLVEVYFQAEDVDTALCLMRHESGGNPNAKNPYSSARGLMQVMASVWADNLGVSWNCLYDPHINLWAAAIIRNRQGWIAWSPWGQGLCRE